MPGTFQLPRPSRRSFLALPRLSRLRLRAPSARSRTAVLVLVLACAVIVVTEGNAPAMLQLPLLLAIAGGLASLRAEILRRLRDRLLARMAGRRREAALFRRLATLCSVGDFPQRQERVSDLVAFVAANAGQSRAEQKRLAIASTLHRVGMVSLPPCGSTDAAEAARQAGRMAERLLSGSTPLHRIATEMAVAHGESWDGTSDILGLAGEAIPFPARLLQVALALDALLPRAGRIPARTALVAIVARLDAEAGRTLDPALAGLPLRHVGKLEILLQSHLCRHNPCDSPSPWWSRSEGVCITRPGCTPA